MSAVEEKLHFWGLYPWDYGHVCYLRAMEFRKYVHEFLKWLPLALGGGVVSVSAVWDGPKKWFGDQTTSAWREMSDPWVGLAVVAVLAAYLVGIIWTDQPREDSRSLAPKLIPDQLYLLKNSSLLDNIQKSYLIVWSPGEYFTIIFSDYESRARQWPPGEPQEKFLTFHLFNPGPDDIRHVRMQWDLSVNIPDLVRFSGLFEGFIEKLNDDRIELLNEGVGWIGRPLAISEETIVPLLRARDTVEVQAPEALNYAFAIYALAEAKRISATPLPETGGSTRNSVLAFQQDTIHLEPLIISIAYEAEEGLRNQSFGIIGDLRGMVGTMSSKPDHGTTDHYSPEPGGITAWLDHIEVVKA